MPVRSSREAMLRQWVADNPIGMYLAEATPERTPRVVSRGLARLLGYASSEDVPLAELWRRHLHPEDRATARAAWTGSSDNESPRRVATYRLNDRGGRAHWMREESAPLEEHPGRVQAVLLDVTEAVEAERRLQHYAHDLRERVKELDCLYAISHLSGEESVPQLLARVAQILPQAWQFPEKAWCRIHFDGKTYESEGAEPGPPGQWADIVIRGDAVGRIEIGYRTDPGADEEPAFLDEEWTLLNGIARSLAEALDRRQAVESLRKSEKLYRTLAMNIPGTLVGLFDRDLRCTLAEGTLKGVLAESRVEGRDLAEVWRGDTALLVELCRDAVAGEDRSVDYWWRGMALSVRVVPVPDVRGDRGGMFVIRDMTDRRELEKEILEVSSREQRRIGQDLHDSLGQLLTGLMCLGGTLNRHLTQDCPQHAARAEEITQIAQQAMLEVRALARGLNPIDLDARGLASSLQELAYDCENIFHVACLCETAEAPPVEDPTAATQLYRIAQEAVSNAVRHGQATTIVLKLYRDDGHGVLSVEDNGRGFSPRGQQRKGMGLRIMQYRTETIGGVFTLRSSRGRGTRIECRFPLGKGESAVRGGVPHAKRSKKGPTNRHRR